MKLSKVGTRFIADCSYTEKDIPKQAGFRFHWAEATKCRPGCYECRDGVAKGWWTNDKVVASRLISFADPACKAELEGVKQSQEASHATDAEIDIPAPQGLEFLPFQKAAVAYALARQNTLYGDQMGLGKSIEALGVINADSSIQNVLVVCPSSLRINWSREAAKWLVRPMKIKIIMERELPEPTDSMVILNYEKVVGARGQVLKDALLARDWDLIIVDEAHYCKSSKTQRTLAILGKGGHRDPVVGLISKARRRLFLTGTPMLNRPIELWPLAHALAPVEFSNWKYFTNRYCDAHHNGWALDVTGASHLDELQEKLRSLFLIRRLKSEVMKELPPKRRQVIVLNQNGAAEAVAEEQLAWQDSEGRLADLRDDADLALASGDESSYKSRVARLKDATQLAFTQISKARHAVALAKVPACVDHINGLLDEASKLVVFCHHKDVLAKLQDALKDYGVVVISGDTDVVNRQASVDAFQTKPEVRVIIGTIGAMGTGWTLTAANVVAFCELDWTPGNITQAEDRCHRMGTTGEYVLVQHLVVDGSLDSRMAQTLIAKQEVADKALDLPYPEFQIPAIPEPVISTTKAVPTAPRAPLPSKWPVATEQEREAALRCLRTLAGVCDGAVARDDVGFNGRDARIGHDLASQTRLTDGQVWLAKRILPKYHNQIPADLLAAAVGKKD